LLLIFDARQQQAYVSGSGFRISIRPANLKSTWTDLAGVAIDETFSLRHVSACHINSLKRQPVSNFERKENGFVGWLELCRSHLSVRCGFN